MMRSPGRIMALVAVGLVAGFLSGLFGVGGGVVIVPALTLLLGYGHRAASGTSLFAIAPSSLAGAISYGVRGDVDLTAAVLIAAGSVLGTQLGVALLHRISARTLSFVFASFVACTLVSLWVVVPTRTGEITLDLLTGVALVLIGVVAGALSGLVGVGGGVVIVPGLQVLLAAGDLVAKGTSLATMVPTSLLGTLGHLRRGSVDLRAGLVVGVAAAAVAPLGTVLAGAIDPGVSRVLFSAFLVLVTIPVLLKNRRPAAR
ncbi:sulfite exporter TauE/SafE family protein [Herbiconiux sp. 11R-BC]|uniref:sulfite exporter TauE/SafE family protein n=1 Tax=Herbiconiux sp. 11R-BC TaxID=3111637 RepID=UPI003BFF3EC5